MCGRLNGGMGGQCDGEVCGRIDAGLRGGMDGENERTV